VRRRVVGNRANVTGARYRGVRRETVPITTLDEDVQKFARPDFIKIDVEGLEIAVLQGAEQTLRKHGPELFIELHGTTVANKVNNAQDVLKVLFDIG
jgi:FkbM family methyltransferase